MNKDMSYEIPFPLQSLKNLYLEAVLNHTKTHLSISGKLYQLRFFKRFRVFQKTNFCCARCKRKVNRATLLIYYNNSSKNNKKIKPRLYIGNDLMTIDHILSRSMGGSGQQLSNLQSLCEPCHVKKTKEENFLRQTNTIF